MVEQIPAERWSRVRKPGEWSPGKDAEHAADAAMMHLSHVARSLGVQWPEPPSLDRAQLTTGRSKAEILVQLRTCAEDGARLIESLSDAQLALAAWPPRKPPRTVGDIVARPLIRHFGTHREEIELKLRARM